MSSKINLQNVGLKKGSKNLMTINSNLMKFVEGLDTVRKDRIKEAGEVIANEVKNEIDQQGLVVSGNLKKGVGITETQNGNIAVRLTSPANHAFLVEYGSYLTSKRTTKKGANRGEMPAKPFFMPAFRKSKDKAIRIITGDLF